ncbi:sin3 histone deacetylase corepressor complex component SDS3, partial [Clonorchis sinensis]
LDRRRNELDRYDGPSYSIGLSSRRATFGNSSALEIRAFKPIQMYREESSVENRIDRREERKSTSSGNFRVPYYYSVQSELFTADEDPYGFCTWTEHEIPLSPYYFDLTPPVRCCSVYWRSIRRNSTRIPLYRSQSVCNNFDVGRPGYVPAGSGVGLSTACLFVELDPGRLVQLQRQDPVLRKVAAALLDRRSIENGEGDKELETFLSHFDRLSLSESGIISNETKIKRNHRNQLLECLPDVRPRIQTATGKRYPKRYSNSERLFAVKLSVRADREAWWTRKAEEMEDAKNAGNVRKLFHLIRSIGPRKPLASEIIRDQNGSLIYNKAERLDRWAQPAMVNLVRETMYYTRFSSKTQWLTAYLSQSLCNGTSIHVVRYLLDNEYDLSDASETDDAYEEKVQDLKRQLKQLDDKTHPDYLKVRRKAEVWLNEEKQRVQILHEHRLETIAREYKKEMEACERDCELEKRRIQEYLVSLCEELKRRLEHDKKNIELTPSGDILDFKPAVTRKLRRRAGTDLPSSSSSNFLFWGDLLLCGPGWPLSAATHCKPSQTDPNHTTSELRSPIPTNGLETSVPDTNTGPTNPDAECTDGPKSLKPADSTTSVVQSGGSGPSSMKSNNLFGSLGMNLFDGSLLSHLLASINSCGGGGSSGSNSYMYFNNSGLYNFMSGPPSGSAAAAVAAGLLMPSALNNPGSNSLAAALGTVAITLTGAPQSTTKKRRQQNAPPAAQLNLLLPENDIYEDLTKIHRDGTYTTQTKPSGHGNIIKVVLEYEEWSIMNIFHRNTYTRLLIRSFVRVKWVFSKTVKSHFRNSVLIVFLVTGVTDFPLLDTKSEEVKSAQGKQCKDQQIPVQRSEHQPMVDVFTCREMSIPMKPEYPDGTAVKPLAKHVGWNLNHLRICTTNAPYQGSGLSEQPKFLVMTIPNAYQ